MIDDQNQPSNNFSLRDSLTQYVQGDRTGLIPFMMVLQFLSATHKTGRFYPNAHQTRFKKNRVHLRTMEEVRIVRNREDTKGWREMTWQIVSHSTYGMVVHASGTMSWRTTCSHGCQRVRLYGRMYQEEL